MYEFRCHHRRRSAEIGTLMMARRWSPPDDTDDQVQARAVECTFSRLDMQSAAGPGPWAVGRRARMVSGGSEPQAGTFGSAVTLRSWTLADSCGGRVSTHLVARSTSTFSGGSTSLRVATDQAIHDPWARSPTMPGLNRVNAVHIGQIYGQAMRSPTTCTPCGDDNPSWKPGDRHDGPERPLVVAEPRHGTIGAVGPHIRTVRRDPGEDRRSGQPIQPRHAKQVHSTTARRATLTRRMTRPHELVDGLASAAAHHQGQRRRHHT
jgi:hypothetical protein